jgi:hypothetical protein
MGRDFKTLERGLANPLQKAKNTSVAGTIKNCTTGTTWEDFMRRKRAPRRGFWRRHAVGKRLARSAARRQWHRGRTLVTQSGATAPVASAYGQGVSDAFADIEKQGGI